MSTEHNSNLNTLFNTFLLKYFIASSTRKLANINILDYKLFENKENSNVKFILNSFLKNMIIATSTSVILKIMEKLLKTNDKQIKNGENEEDENSKTNKNSVLSFVDSIVSIIKISAKYALGDTIIDYLI